MKPRYLALLRLLGIGLLVYLLWYFQPFRVLGALDNSAVLLLAVAVAMNLPQIMVKVVRWRLLLGAQGIPYGLVPASLAYFGSIFVGLLTPGRLGELIKAVHVQRDCDVSSGRAFSSVVMDRLFDLAALAIVGVAALFTLARGSSGLDLILLGTVALFLLMGAAFLHPRGYGVFQMATVRLGKGHLHAVEVWAAELRKGFLEIPPRAIFASFALTTVAYVLFYAQCYLVATAAGIQAGPVEVALAVSLGSLVTLVPLSISGLGTRDAAIIAYLGSLGVPGDAALLFSLLIFITFYLGGAAIGALAWLLKPMPLKQARALRWSRSA